jgi:hypothetical protein
MVVFLEVVKKMNTTPAGITISDSGIDLNKIDTKTEGIKQKYKALGKE